MKKETKDSKTTAANEDAPKPEVKRGRPYGTGAGPTRMIRVLISERQDKTLSVLKMKLGITESEIVRRALDAFFEDAIEKKLIKRG